MMYVNKLAYENIFFFLFMIQASHSTHPVQRMLIKTLPTSLSPSFLLRQFPSSSFMETQSSVSRTNCSTALRPGRWLLTVLFLILSKTTPLMSLGFPGTPKMMNKPRQSSPIKLQNSSSLSNLLLFQEDSSTLDSGLGKSQGFDCTGGREAICRV